MEITHAQIEERSIVLHRVIAQRVSENPALLDVARANLRRWVSRRSGCDQRELPDTKDA